MQMCYAQNHYSFLCFMFFSIDYTTKFEIIVKMNIA